MTNQVIMFFHTRTVLGLVHFSLQMARHLQLLGTVDSTINRADTHTHRFSNEYVVE